MFETQKSGNKTSSGEIGLNIRTLASPKMDAIIQLDHIHWLTPSTKKMIDT